MSYPMATSTNNNIGANKAIGAAIAGALTTLVVYGLSFAKISPPADVVAAVQTLLTLAVVYLTPHGK